jgi:hypothetical protein
MRRSAMPTIDLKPEEIAILRSALDSAEYWEHRDQLPVNSGYVLDPDPEDLKDESVRDAWEEVQALRALDERLRALEEKPEPSQHRTPWGEPYGSGGPSA